MSSKTSSKTTSASSRAGIGAGRSRGTGALNRRSNFNSYRPWQKGTQKPGAMAHSRPHCNGAGSWQAKSKKFRAKNTAAMTKKELNKMNSINPFIQATSDIGQQNQFIVATAFVAMVANIL